jgi:catechol 2,3-dioxygenase-like lactoylglutathione lyase family enzyme
MSAVGETKLNLATLEIKAFVPASDLERSKAFYLDLGFEIAWSSEDLAYVRHRETSFLLQAFHNTEFIKNFQMHLLVENVDDWHSHVVATGVALRYGVEVDEPQDQPWAMRDFTLFDPSGVLWRVAQNIPRKAAT